MIYELVAASSSEPPIKIHHEKNAHPGTYAALARVNHQVRAEYTQGECKNS